MKNGIIILLFAYSSLFSEGFYVKIAGNVRTGKPVSKIKLYILDYETRNDTFLDSIQIDKTTQSFSKTLFIAEPMVINFAIADAQTIPLAFEKTENIQLEISASDYTITGASTSVLIKKYDDFRKLSYKKIMTPLYDSISKYEDAGQIEKMKLLSKTIMRTYIWHKSELSAFVNANMTNSIAAYYSCQRWNADADLDMMATIVQNFKTKFATAKITKHLEARYQRFDKIKIGNIATEIICPDSTGKLLKLSDQKGKYVLLDFWASWCRPCRQESANLVRLYQEFKNKNFDIFAVSLDDKKEKWLQAIAKDKYTWIQISDLIAWKSKAAIDYNIQYIPSNILLDENQNIIARNLNTDEIAAILNKRK